ncbi:MAG: EAL domain-containing protein [Gammaproteobacteria bacterium]|nr:EAL domain-containing protein [Gammaproteobacteria bacterium]
MIVTYDPWLVGLSLIIAAMAAYASLSLAERVRPVSDGTGLDQGTEQATGRWLAWLLGGALVMGLGIWSMHFIGMLAVRLPVAMAYDPAMILGSMLPAFLASLIALFTLRSGKQRPLLLLGAGTVMGGGIAAMHYIGMAAMRMFPAIRYDPLLFWLSILIAVLASIAALSLAFRLKREPGRGYLVKKLLAALIMGLAIAGMHYTGMAAAEFAEGSVCLSAEGGLTAEFLLPWVAGGSLLLLSLTLLASFFDLRLADQNAYLVAQLRQANEQLQERAERLAEQMVSEARAHAERHRMLAAVVEQSSDAIITLDAHHAISSLNRSAEEMFGYAADALLGSSIDRILVLPAGPDGRLSVAGLAEGTSRCEVLGRRSDGSYLSVSLSNAPLFDEAHCRLGTISILRDVTSDRQVSQQLQQAAAVFQSTNEGVVITDENAIIIAANRAFSEITGYTEDEALGQKAGFTKSGLHDEDFYARMWRQIQESGQWSGEIMDRRKNGELYPKWMGISPVRDGEGKIVNYIGVFSDISQLKETQQRLKYVAQHDFLTDLPNRFLFEDRLEQALRKVKRRGRSLALLFLDLDRFKNVNDSLGHVVGDHLLVQVAKRIGSVIREEDTLARLGGDEFTLLLEFIEDQEEAARTAEQVLAAVQEAFQVDGHELFISASIGISLAPQDGDDITRLLKHADAAMYKAKAEGRNRFSFYSVELSQRLARRFEIEVELRRALEQGELRLYYQPQVAVVDRRIRGAEALIRWHHPQKGLIPPDAFLAIAEESSLLTRIEEWALAEACRQLRQWQDQSLPPVRIAVNLSSETISYHPVAAQIQQLLEQWDLPGQSLQLEITEGSLVEHTSLLTSNLAQLAQLGVSVAIDDFGTGYSSMAYLKRFAVSKLKIDKSFVRDIAIDPNDKAIVSAIIAMGHSLGLQVTAEGVENVEQLSYLVQQGCDEIQGYYYSQAVEAEAFARLVQEF